MRSKDKKIEREVTEAPSLKRIFPDVENGHLSVFYEDNHLIAIFKPPGILTQGDHTSGISLLEAVRSWIQKKYQKPGNAFVGLVHRLDRKTSGILLFAKTSKGASRLSEQFRSRVVKKTYRALVEGRVSVESSHTLTHDVVRSVNKTVILNQGKPKDKDKFHASQSASLTYRSLAQYDRLSLIEISLHTGRKHQIRAQLAHIGHPILGDTQYGSHLKWGVPSFETRNAIALVSHQLSFYHPTQKHLIELSLPSSHCIIQYYINQNHL